MLIARAPVRISLAGGGTDLPAYYEEHGGEVVSGSIDKYFYTFLHVTDAEDIQITSSDYRLYYRHEGDRPLLWDGDLSLPRAILHQFGISSGLSMFLASEVPPGTGLGSSSTVAVAIIKALATGCGMRLTRHEIAEMASWIEIEKLGMPIGKQDQYAATFGGLNAFSFSRSGVEVQPLTIAPGTVRELERRLMLFYTGASREAASILGEQRRASQARDGAVLDALHRVKDIAVRMRTCLEQGNVDRVGMLLHESWEHKRRFAANVSNPSIDEFYRVARAHGAVGGKITGAGGGGFLLLHVQAEARNAVAKALEGLGLKQMAFRFEWGGARVLMNASLQLKATRAEVWTTTGATV